MHRAMQVLSQVLVAEPAASAPKRSVDPVASAARASAVPAVEPRSPAHRPTRVAGLPSEPQEAVAVSIQFHCRTTPALHLPNRCFGPAAPKSPRAIPVGWLVRIPAQALVLPMDCQRVDLRLVLVGLAVGGDLALPMLLSGRWLLPSSVPNW
jgi:hypothetical protein